MTVSGPMAERAKQLILGYLADDEWHGHHEIVLALKGHAGSEQAVREVLKKLRNSGQVEVEDHRLSYRHGKSWYYRMAADSSRGSRNSAGR